MVSALLRVLLKCACNIAITFSFSEVKKSIPGLFHTVKDMPWVDQFHLGHVRHFNYENTEISFPAAVLMSDLLRNLNVVICYLNELIINGS